MPFETPDALSEPATAQALALLSTAFRRKVTLEMTVVYHRTLDRAGISDYQLARSTEAIMANEERFPTVATILKYARGEGKGTESDEGAVIRGTTIRARDYIRNPDQYGEVLCRMESDARAAAAAERRARGRG